MPAHLAFEPRRSRLIEHRDLEVLLRDDEAALLHRPRTGCAARSATRARTRTVRSRPGIPEQDHGRLPPASAPRRAPRRHERRSDATPLTAREHPDRTERETSVSPTRCPAHLHVADDLAVDLGHERERAGLVADRLDDRRLPAAGRTRPARPRRRRADPPATRAGRSRRAGRAEAAVARARRRAARRPTLGSTSRDPDDHQLRDAIAARDLHRPRSRSRFTAATITSPR